MTDEKSRGLRVAAIVLMGLTTTMNILGGAGTVCAAFLTKQFPPMWALLDYQLLYQSLMIITILIGVAGIWSTMGLVRGGPNAYRNALIVLIVGTLVGGIHVYASFELRGKTVPANMKLYMNLLTLIVFLLLKLPGLRNRVDFSEPGDRSNQITSSGLAAIINGSIILTTPLWIASSHTYAGNEWVDVLRTPLYIAGGGLVFLGIGFLLSAVRGTQIVFSDRRA
jgi:hypothetical protein